MSYYATIEGMITLKKPVVNDAILARISEFSPEFEPEVFSEDETSVTFWFGGYQRYYDDEIFDFLAEVETCTESGEITYVGEDNTLWRHYFDPEQKRWFEQNGYVEYEKEGKTITALQDHYEELRVGLEQASLQKSSSPER